MEVVRSSEVFVSCHITSRLLQLKGPRHVPVETWNVECETWIDLDDHVLKGVLLYDTFLIWLVKYIDGA